MTAGNAGVLRVVSEDMRRITIEDRDLRNDVDMFVAQTVNAVIAAAIRYGASDIHFEPLEGELRVRIRIDGHLFKLVSLEKQSEQQIMSRLKVMCRMKMDELRLPQDGRISLLYKDEPYSRRYNIRASIVPKQLPDQPAEKMVLRILGSTVNITLDQLGLSDQVRTGLETVLGQPQGMFLLTGPTGSGKTTTLNAMLTKLNDLSVNILTIEDPIEYHIAGITQVQVHEMIGLTFASALRSFLRQDPDIIMIGEMRDMETAQMAVRAALTGHLVLSTLHTNDAPSAVPRLIDLGIEPYLIPSTLMGVMAQRLVRLLCPNCREPYQTTARELLPLGYTGDNLDAPVVLCRPKGCDACRNSGYQGRRGIYEMMLMTPEIRKLVGRGADMSLDDIRSEAKKSGMRELREEGLDLVLKGLTSVDQVRRVVFTAEVADVETKPAETPPTEG